MSIVFRTTTLTASLEATLMSSDRHVELADETLSAGVQVRKVRAWDEGKVTLQASSDGEAWYNYRTSRACCDEAGVQVCETEFSV